MSGISEGEPAPVIVPVGIHYDRKRLFRSRALVVFHPPAEAGAIVTEAAAREEHPAIWLQEGIRADAEVEAARADGLTVVQDLCTYKVHRALGILSSEGQVTSEALGSS